MKAEFTADEKMVVMISGANRGIGEEIAKKLISEGYIPSLGTRKSSLFKTSSVHLTGIGYPVTGTMPKHLNRRRNGLMIAMPEYSARLQLKISMKKLSTSYGL